MGSQEIISFGNFKDEYNMEAKEFKKVLLFMCNKWSKGESNLIFNGTDFEPEKWKYSLGEHVWNKWLEMCESHHGPVDATAMFFLDGIDTKCLQKIIDRAIEYYDKGK